LGVELVINAGSSSLKWSLFKDQSLVLTGVFDRLGAKTVFRFGKRQEFIGNHDHSSSLEYLVRFLHSNQLFSKPVSVVVHRVVHGGERYAHPVVIDEQVEADIKSLSVLAPLHNPANLAGIRAAKKAFPQARHIAVFDTAFHHTISKEVFLYGLPLDLYKRFRIRKYGFHGISHSYIAHLLKERYGDYVDAISCHLGSGSSITALRHGRSVDTTMGFTPLDGLLMGTRSGELDPEIPLFLLREGHYSPEELEELLTKRSGLLGLTGHSDLRDVWSAAQGGDAASRLALDMLSYRVAYFINAMRTGVPSPRAIVFTAGIGEGAWYVRDAVCRYLRLPLDETANKEHAELISSEDSPVEVLVLCTDEQLQMLRLSEGALGR
jgi:acetate kinase